jgi:hypothetical protein
VHAVPEKVSGIDVTFLAPDSGWSRLTIRTKHQELSWPLSYVYDPFEDFIVWLEAVVKAGNGTLSIDIEGDIAKIQVADVGDDTVRFFGESVYESRTDLLFDMPRPQFVSDFYSKLVAFWESPDLKQNWDEWMLYLKRSDWREDFKPEVQQWIQQPWPIRSEMIEAYLAAVK